jgi:hypothetical protein
MQLRITFEFLIAVANSAVSGLLPAFNSLSSSQTLYSRLVSTSYNCLTCVLMPFLIGSHRLTLILLGVETKSTREYLKKKTIQMT